MNSFLSLILMSERMVTVKKYFVNPQENRLRAGWRILLFLIVAIFISASFNLGVKLLGGPPEDATVSIVVRGVFVIFMATVAVWVGRRFLDKKSITSLGLKFDRQAVLDILAGLVLSGIMVGLVFVTLFYFGFLQVTDVGWTGRGTSPVIGTLLWFFGIGVAVAWSEELVFRGYLLQNLRDGTGIVWATTIMCVFYGIVHMPNPNSTWLSGTLIALIGFVRIFGWLRSGQLWLSMGMHAGWNFFQGPVFGFQVSGTSIETLVTHSVTGPAWISGGSFGPEAGIVVVPVVALGLLAMFIWTAKRKCTPWTNEIRKTN